MMAMTAARLGLRDEAVDLLLRDGANFRFGVAGMTPRGQLEASRRARRSQRPTAWPRPTSRRTARCCGRSA